MSGYETVETLGLISKWVWNHWDMINIIECAFVYALLYFWFYKFTKDWK
jgi:hypothetical protein